MVARGELTEGHARAVLALRDHDAAPPLARRIARDGLSVRAAERAARRAAPPDAAPRGHGRPGARRARLLRRRAADRAARAHRSGRSRSIRLGTELEELAEALERPATRNRRPPIRCPMGCTLAAG